jgi:carbonic anhydrase
MGTVMVEGDFGVLRLRRNGSSEDQDVYTATSIHLTSPSLHSFDGQFAQVELLIFHRPNGDRDMLHHGVVVSVLYDEDAGAESELLSSLGATNLDDASDSYSYTNQWRAESVNLHEEVKEVLKGDSYMYNGSVPVPPCAENIKWFVLQDRLPVGALQVAKLKALLRENLERDVIWRQPRPQFKYGECDRQVVKNTINLGGDHAVQTCFDARNHSSWLRSANCWAQIDRCWDKHWASENVDTAKAIEPGAAHAAEEVPNVHSDEKLFHYVEVGSGVHVKPTRFSLDAGFMSHSEENTGWTMDGRSNFGHLLLNGHVYFAKITSFKAISEHSINGVRYHGELLVRHTMFGDTTLHEGLSHEVVLVVPLRLGHYNELLGDLGLDGTKVERIRQGSDYSITRPIDLNRHLQATLNGSWYWYSSNSTHRDCGSSVRWVVLETPLEVSLSQLNHLSLPVSGVDSSQPTRDIPQGFLWHRYIPAKGVETIEGSCHDAGYDPWTIEVYLGLVDPKSQDHWGYGNERCWYAHHPICHDGQRQSPIDINMSAASTIGDDNFLHRVSWKPVDKLSVSNNGHALQVSTNQLGYTTLIGDNGFPDYYQILQFHLHMPSEHMINGHQAAAELHVVHAAQENTWKYNFSNLLVAGFMFDIVEGREDQESPLLSELFLPDGVEDIDPKVVPESVDDVLRLGRQEACNMSTGTCTKELRRPLDLMRHLGPALQDRFYRYDGSLTTPPCAEAVKWFVFGKRLPMTTRQWKAFKALYDNPSNNRPIQPTYGRKISINSFEEGRMAKYDFFLDRDTGRNREKRGEYLIMVPIIGGILLATAVMFSLFVSDKPDNGIDGGSTCCSPCPLVIVARSERAVRLEQEVEERYGRNLIGKPHLREE